MKYLLTAWRLLTILTNSLFQEKRDLGFTIQINKTDQQMQRIEASCCWFSEDIDRSWRLVSKHHGFVIDNAADWHPWGSYELGNSYLIHAIILLL